MGTKLTEALSSSLRNFPQYEDRRGSLARLTLSQLGRIEKLASRLENECSFLLLLQFCMATRQVWLRLLIVALSPHQNPQCENWLTRFIASIEKVTAQRGFFCNGGLPKFQADLASRYFDNINHRRRFAGSLLSRDGVQLHQDLSLVIGEVDPEAYGVWKTQPIESNAGPSAQAHGMVAGAWWLLLQTLAGFEFELAEEAGPFQASLDQHMDLASTAMILVGTLIEAAERADARAVADSIVQARNLIEDFTEKVTNSLWLLLTSSEAWKEFVADTAGAELGSEDIYRQCIEQIRVVVKQLRLRAQTGWKAARGAAPMHVWWAWVSLLLWEDRTQGSGSLGETDVEIRQNLVDTLAGLEEATDAERLEALLAWLETDQEPIEESDSPHDIALALLKRLLEIDPERGRRAAARLILNPPVHFFPGFALSACGVLSNLLTRRTTERTESPREREVEWFEKLIRDLLKQSDGPYGGRQRYGSVLASLASQLGLRIGVRVDEARQFRSLLEDCRKRLGEGGAVTYFCRFIVDELATTVCSPESFAEHLLVLMAVRQASRQAGVHWSKELEELFQAASELVA